MSEVDTKSDETVTIPRWEIKAAPDGTTGRGDWAVEQQNALLIDGWEPFAVYGGRVWFKRLVSAP